MQIIAPDFYAPFGGSSSASNEDRPGDGLFDALLRDEEARYNPAPRPERDHLEAARPPRESDRRDDDLRSDRHELHGDDREPRRATEAAGENHRQDPAEEDYSAVPHDDRGMNDRGMNGEAKTAADQDKPASPAGETPHEQVAEVVTPEPSAVPLNPAVTAAVVPLISNKATTAETAPPKTTGGEHSQTASQAAPTDKAGAPVAAPVAGSGPKAGAAAGQPTLAPATAEQASGNAAPAAAITKAPNQAAAMERQVAAQPAFVAVDRATRPAGRATGATDSGDVGQNGLNSRPSAVLGGGAATAALSQANQPASVARPGATAQPATGEAVATDQTQPATGKQTAPQAATTGKSPEVAIAAGADKLAQASQTSAASGGVETTAGSSTAQSASAPIAGTASTAGGQINNTTFAETLSSARHSVPADPAEQIALQLRHAQVAGKDRISIKLHPAELGRIEVKLESGSDGTLRAVISAERADTLDLLQRDARGLERALQDAGVKTDSGSLNFNLRGQGQGNERQAGSENAPRRGRDGDGLENTGEAVVAAQQQAASSHSGALDIRV